MLEKFLSKCFRDGSFPQLALPLSYVIVHIYNTAS